MQRVAAVFTNNGSGVRGDMKAVITAILMDPEARRGDDPATAVAPTVTCRNQFFMIAGLMRAFGATTDGSNLSYYASTWARIRCILASVFNFYSPDYVIPGTTSWGRNFRFLPQPRR